MKKMLRLISTLISIFLYSKAVLANVPNYQHPNTFIGPTARASFTTPITDTTAFSLAGEAGLNNSRVGGTVGWRIDPTQRVKLSIEYLWQDITYAFLSGNVHRWMGQGAIGGNYERLLSDYPFKPTFDLSGYYSHVASKSLGTRAFFIANQSGAPQLIIDERRIAGSNAGGLAPGFTFTPWLGSRFGLALNFDNVRYNTRFEAKNATGFGGTAYFNQMITDSIGISASAAVRQPFNNYSTKLTWENVHFYGNWTLGVFGDYTAGKASLPNTYNVGLSADYFLFPSLTKSKSLKGDLNNDIPPSSIRDDFLKWTANPAVYLPQVLTAADQRITSVAPTPSCNIAPPVAIGEELALVIFAPNVTPIFTANRFVPASGLTYAITVTPVPTGGNSVTLNASTGEILINAVSQQDFVITESATNACGATAVSAPMNISIFEMPAR